jgi:uncharacterized protein YraI
LTFSSFGTQHPRTSLADIGGMGTIMNFRMLAALVLAFVGLATFPISASAATAYTTGTLNVRSGPGPGYARIATLPAGYRVTVFGCEGSWCSIRAAGIRGWASSNYLDRVYARPIVVRPHIIVRPPVCIDRTGRISRTGPVPANARSRPASPANNGRQRIIQTL